MAKTEFVFNPYPVQYRSSYSTDTQSWNEEFLTLPHKPNESELTDDERAKLWRTRNYGNDLPLVNYTTQYGFGCFEGLKAYPNTNGGLALFRPGASARRFYNSMKGLLMPPLPEDMYLSALDRLIRQSADLGFKPTFKESWIAEHFATARGLYIRPFSYSEGGFGINITHEPCVIMMATEVGNYVEILDCPALVVSNRVRATANGTGWIKCSANYVASILAKKEAQDGGYQEALFLDGQEHKYIEECSSCNVFFVLKNTTIVTPELGDTILPGITRDSVIQLAKDAGHTVDERRISIQEAMDDAVECFSTGTAVGVSHFGKITHGERTVQFGDGRIGPLAAFLQQTLKSIQHGLAPDTRNWLHPVI